MIARTATTQPSAQTATNPRERRVEPMQVEQLIKSLFGEDLHAKRVISLANATIGVLNAATLGVHAIGLGLARERGLNEKHAVKQVDRFLSNQGIDPWELARRWVPYIIGERDQIAVALDWTDFDADDQSTLMLAMLTKHGRATPLLWKTWRKSTLATHRNEYEDELLSRLREVVPPQVRVTIVADRGFGDKKLYDFLHGELGFDYLIRFRGGIHVTAGNGEVRDAHGWVGRGGRATTLRAAAVTEDKFVVPTVVCVQAKGMKEPWCLASSDGTAKGTDLVKLYAKRWSIETSFRDTKDLHFGMGLSWTHIGRPDRRDRILFIAALAIALLTLLGSAGETLGMDRLLKANTVKRRTHSLLRQGFLYYMKLPTMREAQFSALMAKFNDLIMQHAVLRDLLGVL